MTVAQQSQSPFTSAAMESEFDAWQTELYRRTEDALNPHNTFEALSDSGYWRTMCMAAWAAVAHPEMQSVDVATRECMSCLFREAEPAGEDEDLSDELIDVCEGSNT